MSQRSINLLNVIAFCCLLTCCCGKIAAQEGQPRPEHLEFFEKKVRPLLAEHCYSCHSLGEQENQGGLLLDSRSALIAGGDSGEAIVPGHPDDSLLMSAVRYEDYEMPPSGQLPDDQVAILEKWIQLGAPWPAEDKASGPAIEKFDLDARRKAHWVWQPIEKVSLPVVDSDRWSKTAIDQFIYAKLDDADLTPATKAEPLAIARRLNLDLIGLPLTLAGVAAFERDLDQSLEVAIENLTDKLLASEHFGERWGRHWLDLARYAESRGHEYDPDIPNAFQYRDYVIRALNADVPYDQFVREQIAGDLLDEPRMNPERGFDESVIGTGFWQLGEATHSPVDIRKDESDRFDNMIDVASKSFLGVTVSCARCHDHKFDAISTADYYSMTGFLQSSDYHQVRFESVRQNGKVAHKLAELNQTYIDEIAELLCEQGIKQPDAPEPIDNDKIIFDFSNLAESDYLQDGYIFGKRPLQVGDAYVAETDGSKSIRIATRGFAANDPIWNQLKNVTVGKVQDRNVLHTLSKSGRMLRTPTFEVTQGDVSCLVSGHGHVIACVDSHRQIQGPLHRQTVVKLKSNSKNWAALNLMRYIGHRVHLEFVPAEGEQISVQLVADGLDADGQRQLNDQLEKAEHAYRKYADKAESLLNENDFASEIDDAENRNRLSETVKRWKERRELLSKEIIFESRLAPATMDGDSEDAFIYVRGNSSKLGNVEPRHFLTAITGNDPMEIPTGSGRLQLAAEINDADNPLTSRVITNRIWHYLMGRGLVPTTDDFGVLGQRPTHPKLLDYLAENFRADGQSIKRMIKQIVMTETYQMASRPNADSVQADPTNLLWHHRPPKRLEGEIIRDSLLAISGSLDVTIGGPSVPIHLTNFMGGRGRPKQNGPLDGDQRRSIYVSVRRNFMSPFMTTFDTPVPFSTMGRRTVSNVPAQALILMNDPFVLQQAKAWARRCLETKTETQERVEWFYKSAFARPPTEIELQTSLSFLGDGSDPEIWKHFAHALINTKEFIFVR